MNHFVEPLIESDISFCAGNETTISARNVDSWCGAPGQGARTASMKDVYQWLEQLVVERMQGRRSGMLGNRV